MCACDRGRVKYLCTEVPSNICGMQQLFGYLKRDARFESKQEDSLEIIQGSKGLKKNPQLVEIYFKMSEVYPDTRFYIQLSHCLRLQTYSLGA